MASKAGRITERCAVMSGCSGERSPESYGGEHDGDTRRWSAPRLSARAVVVGSGSGRIHEALGTKRLEGGALLVAQPIRTLVCSSKPLSVSSRWAAPHPPLPVPRSHRS